MCLLAVVFGIHPEAPLVIAANRDERLTRPAEPVQVLCSTTPQILGGRDALAGGTWLAVNEHGLSAGLANRPSIGGRDLSRRSRGELPLILADHARAGDAVAAFGERVRCTEYNPCWLLVGDREALFYIVIGRSEKPEIIRLPPGIHVLENRPLDVVSAKAEMIRRALTPVGGWLGPTLVTQLHAVLRSHEFPARELPDDVDDDAGLRPPQVQAACVHTPDYGTRSASLIIVSSEPDSFPRVYYADGPPCMAPLLDASHLWSVRAAPAVGPRSSHER
ncbi:MAG: NRDE family protein [Candidatus Rokubacteria bacterium]|nr:NRDE family protein [Candidatus Rokubacteria bacterium]